MQRLLEVGLGKLALEDRWELLRASPSVSPEAEDRREGQGWLSRRQCGQLRGRQGTGREIMPFGFTACLPSSASSFSGGRGGTEGVVEEVEREKSHTLCPQ